MSATNPAEPTSAAPSRKRRQPTMPVTIELADVVRQEFLRQTSLRRFVSAEDIAHAIVFLASPCGANISGHALPVDSDTQALS